MGESDDKEANEVLPNWVSIFGTPDIVLADKDSRFTGSDFRDFVKETELYRRLFHGTIRAWDLLKGDVGI